MKKQLLFTRGGTIPMVSEIRNNLLFQKEKAPSEKGAFGTGDPPVKEVQVQKKRQSY